MSKYKIFDDLIENKDDRVTVWQKSAEHVLGEQPLTLLWRVSPGHTEVSRGSDTIAQYSYGTMTSLMNIHRRSA